MLMTLIASLGGGIFRMLPELMKFFTAKDDRKHEKEMFALQLEADKLKAANNLAQTNAESAGAMGLAEITAIIEATKAQAVQTGIKWVDAASALMRPIITFWWCIVMYTGALIANYFTLIQDGMTNATALLEIWGPDEKAICASIISFWFVDRSLRKK